MTNPHTQSKAKQSKAKQSKAKQSKAKQSKAKQSKAKQSSTDLFQHYSRIGEFCELRLVRLQLHELAFGQSHVAHLHQRTRLQTKVLHHLSKQTHTSRRTAAIESSTAAAQHSACVTVGGVQQTLKRLRHTQNGRYATPSSALNSNTPQCDF